MKGSRQTVQSFCYGSPDLRQAKLRYAMALRGIHRVDNLHKLLGFNPGRSMVSMVLLGQRKSAPLESRIATVLGMTREELFGTEEFRPWRIDEKGAA